MKGCNVWVNALSNIDVTRTSVAVVESVKIAWMCQEFVANSSQYSMPLHVTKSFQMLLGKAFRYE